MQCHSSLRCGNCGLAIVHTSAPAHAATPSTKLFDKMREIAASTGNAVYTIPKTDACYKRKWNRSLEWDEDETEYINNYFQPHGWKRVYTKDRNYEYEYYFKDEYKPLYCKLTVHGGYASPTDTISVQKADANSVNGMIRVDPKNSYDRVINHDIEDSWHGEPRDY